MQTRKKWRLLIKSGKPRQTITTAAAVAIIRSRFRICLAVLPVSKCLSAAAPVPVYTRRTNPIKMRISFRARARATHRKLQLNSDYNLEAKKNDPVQEGSRKERDVLLPLLLGSTENFSKVSLNLPSESVIRENIILVIGRSRGGRKQREKIRHAATIKYIDLRSFTVRSIVLVARRGAENHRQNPEKPREKERNKVPPPPPTVGPGPLSDLRIELPRCIPRWF